MDIYNLIDMIDNAKKISYSVNCDDTFIHSGEQEVINVSESGDKIEITLNNGSLHLPINDIKQIAYSEEIVIVYLTNLTVAISIIN